ncbi:DUF5403 family protein [Mobiluncus curtisii]|uniref:DUF5403 family protein n=1 Tax=Mobiluncus curtisii TaxID=2051 RepID=UPI00242BEE1A|nr:DUF5403 family protein [Mobiluncus curtisii]
MVQLMRGKDFNILVTAAVKNDPEWAVTGRAVAEQIQATWVALAAKHTKTGHYAGSIRISHGDVDWHVTATDHAAAHIEFGHDLEPGESLEPRNNRRRTSRTGRGVEIRRGKKFVRPLHLARNTVKTMHALGYAVRIGKK